MHSNILESRSIYFSFSFSCTVSQINLRCPHETLYHCKNLKCVEYMYKCDIKTNMVHWQINISDAKSSVSLNVFEIYIIYVLYRFNIRSYMLRKVGHCYF